MWDHAIYCAPDEVAYWNAVSKYSDTVVHSSTSGSPGFSRMESVFTRLSPSGASPADDVCIYGLSFAATTPTGGLCTPLLAGGKATVETQYNTLWTTLKNQLSSDFTLKELRWYDYAFHSTRPGPAARITAIGTNGALGTTRLPDQDALTVSFRTASRKHWGRVFIPGLCSANLSTFGLYNTIQVDSAAGAFHTFMNAIKLSDGDPELVVASIKYAGVLTVSQLSVDNIVDIQRRRRANAATYHKIYTS